MLAMRFLFGGRVLAIHDDDFPWEKAFGPEFARQRRRASIINTVEEGPFAGRFYADMSYLADQTGNDAQRVCLWPPEVKERDCKRDEVNYINANFIQKE